MIKTPTERLKEKLTRENLWLYILSILTKKDAYGYDLRREIDSIFWFKPGNVSSYAVLYKLEKSGFVRTYPKEVNGRVRKYYQITEKGRSELKEGKEILEKTLKSL